VEFTRLTGVRSKDGHEVPAYLLRPPSPAAGVAIAHGYGGCKEHMLGLAARVAERGLAACVFDIRGHGEHPAPLDAAMLEDLEAILTFLRRFGRVAVAGHSLGGRLALMSSADGDIPSLIEAVRATAAAMPTAHVQAISQHQHRGGELPANLLAYLPRWFNHIDLKANAELYVRVPGWLAGRLGGRPE